LILLEWYSILNLLSQPLFSIRTIETFIISSSEEKLVDTCLFTLYRADPQFDPLIALGPRTAALTPTILRSTEKHFFTVFLSLYISNPLVFYPSHFDGLGMVANYTRVSAGEITGLSKNSI